MKMSMLRMHACLKVRARSAVARCDGVFVVAKTEERGDEFKPKLLAQRARLASATSDTRQAND
jgi:hypothetical protein